MEDITYPWAYIRPYMSVHISESVRGIPHYCFGCDREMVLKQGEKRAWHFAHKAGFVECDVGNALHETAKEIICRGFISATDSGTRYWAGYPCGSCQDSIYVNIAISGASIASERAVVPGTRSDLVVTKADGKTSRLVIEIKVTHDLESATRKRYEDSHIPVIKVVPSWETLIALRNRVLGDETLNITEKLCADCKRRENADEERRRKEIEEHQRLKAWAKGAVSDIRPGTGVVPRLTAIIQDCYGSYLRASTRQQVMKFARKLAWLGFKQLPPNRRRNSPTLFVFNAGGWNIYADLDSTEVMRIWEVDCVPALYSFPSMGVRGCRECLLDAVQAKLDQHGVPYRRHFEDTDGHSHDFGYPL